MNMGKWKVAMERCWQKKAGRRVLEIVDTQSLAPENRLLRKIDIGVDFKRNYAMVDCFH